MVQRQSWNDSEQKQPFLSMQIVVSFDAAAILVAKTDFFLIGSLD